MTVSLYFVSLVLRKTLEYTLVNCPRESSQLTEHKLRITPFLTQHIKKAFRRKDIRTRRTVYFQAVSGNKKKVADRCTRKTFSPEVNSINKPSVLPGSTPIANFDGGSAKL